MQVAMIFTDECSVPLTCLRCLEMCGVQRGWCGAGLLQGVLTREVGADRQAEVVWKVEMEEDEVIMSPLGSPQLSLN